MGVIQEYMRRLRKEALTTGMTSADAREAGAGGGEVFGHLTQSEMSNQNVHQ